MSAYVDALNEEREQMEKYGRVDRVKAVDDELRRVGALRSEQLAPSEPPAEAQPVAKKRATKRAK